MTSRHTPERSGDDSPPRRPGSHAATAAPSQPLQVGEERLLRTIVPRQQPRGFAPDVRAPEEGFQFGSRRLGVGVPEGRRPRPQYSVRRAGAFVDRVVAEEMIRRPDVGRHRAEFCDARVHVCSIIIGWGRPIRFSSSQSQR